VVGLSKALPLNFRILYFFWIMTNSVNKTKEGQTPGKKMKSHGTVFAFHHFCGNTKGPSSLRVIHSEYYVLLLTLFRKIFSTCVSSFFVTWFNKFRFFPLLKRVRLCVCVGECGCVCVCLSPLKSRGHSCSLKYIANNISSSFFGRVWEL